MDGYLFERCIVETIAELAALRGIKQKPLAKKAWPDNAQADNKWRYIRKLEKPRGLQVCDAYDLVSALGMSFTEVCGLAQAKLLQKQQGQDVNFRSREAKVERSAGKEKQKAIDPDATEGQKAIDA